MNVFDIIGSKLPAGLSVIEASAGTGKTYALSHLVPRLLLDGTAPNLRSILLVTFTNDAARELSNRVRNVLTRLQSDSPTEDEAKAWPDIRRLRTDFCTEQHRAILHKALLEIDQLQVSTIHSFCQKTLQTEGALSGVPVMPELIPSVEELIHQIVTAVWEEKIAASPMASAVAHSQRWNPKEDVEILKRFLPESEAEPRPDFGGFETALNALAADCQAITPAHCNQLTEICNQVTKWNRSALPIDLMKRDLQALQKLGQDPFSNQNTGWMESLKTAATLPESMNGTSHKKLKAEAQQAPLVQHAKNFIEQTKNLRWAFRLHCLKELRKKLHDALKQNLQIHYDGLITRLHEAIHGPNGDALVKRLQARYQIALIDESQDTDQQQFALFEKIFLHGEHRLVLIGDPKQAIYGFRGADVNTYLAARGKAVEQFQMTRTFRAPAPLVKAVNTIFKHPHSHPHSLLKEKLDFRPAESGKKGDVKLLSHDGDNDEARVEFWVVADAGQGYQNAKSRNRRIADEVASEVVRLLGTGRIVTTSAEGATSEKKVQPEDFAVLVSSNFEGRLVEEALKARRVPAVRVGDDDVMASDEASELLALFRALKDPRRKELRFAALATRLLGKTVQDLRQMTEHEAMLPEFLRWEQMLLRHGPSPTLAMIDREMGIVQRLATLAQGDRRITNFRQLCDLLQSIYTEQHRHLGQLLRWFETEVAEADERTNAEERQLQLESDALAVRIVTMHKSKGLEYPLVFCPFLWATMKIKDQTRLALNAETKLIDRALLAKEAVPSRFLDPLTRDLDRLMPGLSVEAKERMISSAVQSPEEAALNRTALEERLRLAYVAITRAQVKVWIHAGDLHSESKTKLPSALDWLLREEHLDSDRSKIDDTTLEAWRLNLSEAGNGTPHQARLNVLVETSGGTISQKAPPEPSLDVWQPAQTVPHPTQLQPEPAPAIAKPWQLTSFTAITREDHQHSFAPLSALPPEADFSGAPPNPFFDAPGSKLVGDAIHQWIEPWDFGEPDREAVARHLAGFSLPQAKNPAALPMNEAVHGMLRQLRAARLPGFDCTIAEACPEPKASEWHFHLPIRGTLSPACLAAIFATDPQPGFESYADRLAALKTDALNGYLHGFIDRLARHPAEPRWGVIDWKTNTLGKSLHDYRPESLRACAMESHYYLQTHLYLVALRRYLGGKAAIAGAWLVFLRGIAAGSDRAILAITPTEQRLNALDQLFFKP